MSNLRSSIIHAAEDTHGEQLPLLAPKLHSSCKEAFSVCSCPLQIAQLESEAESAHADSAAAVGALSALNESMTQNHDRDVDMLGQVTWESSPGLNRCGRHS